VALLLQEAFRHGKAVGAWGNGLAALASANIATDVAGIVTADSATGTLAPLMAALGKHRAWERFVVTA
jgi:catalase